MDQQQQQIQIPKYQYTPNPNSDRGAIHVTDGHYKDLVYSYGVISFSSKENPSVNFTYNIIDNPNSVAQDQELTNLMGLILTDIIEKNASEVGKFYGTNRANNPSEPGKG